MSTVAHSCKVKTCGWTWRQTAGEEPKCPRCERLKKT